MTRYYFKCCGCGKEKDIPREDYNFFVCTKSKGLISMTCTTCGEEIEALKK